MRPKQVLTADQTQRSDQIQKSIPALAASLSQATEVHWGLDTQTGIPRSQHLSTGPGARHCCAVEANHTGLEADPHDATSRRWFRGCEHYVLFALRLGSHSHFRQTLLRLMPRPGRHHGVFHRRLRRCRPLIFGAACPGELQRGHHDLLNLEQLNSAVISRTAVLLSTGRKGHLRAVDFTLNLTSPRQS